jgi:uncharacterized protein (DUF849 family)
MKRTIIEVALSGPGQRWDAGALGREIIACIDAGAAIVHNHLDGHGASGSAAAAAYGAIWAPVLAVRPDAILYPTLAPPTAGDSLGRYGHAVETAVKHGARMAPFDPGSVNLAASQADGQPDTLRQFAYVNDYATLDLVLDAYAADGIASSISIFDPSFLRAAMAYERAGRFMPGSFLKLYFGGSCAYLDGLPGLSFGLPPTVRALELYLEMMAGSQLPWAAAVPGGDILAESEFVSAVLAHGGHLRVGLEDNGGPRAPGNVEQVTRAAALAARHGRPAATSAEAAELLGLGPSN